MLKVTNGLILDLHCFMNKNGSCSYHTFKNWIAALLHDNWPGDQPPTVKALCQNAVRLASRLTKLKKERNSEVKKALMTSFLDEEYSLSKLFTSRGQIIRCTSSSPTTHDWEKQSLKLANEELCDELSQMRLKTSELEQRELKLKKSQQKMYCKHRNEHKRLQRRERELDIRKKEIIDEKQEIRDLQRELKERKSGIDQMKKSMDRLRHRAVYVLEGKV